MIRTLSTLAAAASAAVGAWFFVRRRRFESKPRYRVIVTFIRDNVEDEKVQTTDDGNVAVKLECGNWDCIGADEDADTRVLLPLRVVVERSNFLDRNVLRVEDARFTARILDENGGEVSSALKTYEGVPGHMISVPRERVGKYVEVFIRPVGGSPATTSYSFDVFASDCDRAC